MNERQKQIAATATDLFLTEGVGVSTARIAKVAGVSNGTLFNAFPTKQALIDAIYADAKTQMFAAVPNAGDAPFTRDRIRQNWEGYLAWAGANQQKCKVMHFLLESGLASQETQDKINALAAPHAAWLQGGLDAGLVQGPSVAFLGNLLFFFADHIINNNLSASEADLLFEMLCNAIGLKE